MTLAGIRRAASRRLDWKSPALPAADGESQFQLPFALPGDSIRLEVSAGGQALAYPLPVRQTSPAVLIDREGTPYVLDADSGVAIDAMNPLRGGMKSRFSPRVWAGHSDWPAGRRRPHGRPKVVAKVSVPIDGVTGRAAEAAPCARLYGFYLIEARCPPCSMLAPPNCASRPAVIKADRLPRLH